MFPSVLSVHAGPRLCQTVRLNTARQPCGPLEFRPGERRGRPEGDIKSVSEQKRRTTLANVLSVTG